MARKFLAAGTSPRRLGVEIFLFFLFLYLLTANGRIVSGDGEAMFQVARSIAEAGRVDIPPESALETSAGPRGTDGHSLSFATETAKRGVDGRVYAMYGLGQSLVTVPFYYAGKLIAYVAPAVNHYFATRFAAAMLNPVVSALACAALFAYAYSLGFALRASLLVALTYGVTTMAWPYAKSYFSEPLTGLLLIVSSLGLIRSSSSRVPLRWSSLAGAALGFAVMVRVSTGVLIPVFVLYWLAIARGRGVGVDTSFFQLGRRARIVTSAWEAGAFLLPLTAILALIGWYNQARFGSLLVTGYQSIAWNRPLVNGLYGLLLSPGKGLFWYSPILILSVLASVAFFRWRKREALFFAGLGVVWLLFHAPYRFWEGGWSWGPRLMLPILPFLVLFTGVLYGTSGFPKWVGRRLLPAAIALGLAVQVSAVGADYTRYLLIAYSSDPDGMYERVIYQPAGSPLVGQWTALVAVLANAARPGELAKMSSDFAEQQARLKAEGRSEAERSEEVLAETSLAGVNFPDFWFIYLYLFKGSTELTRLMALILLAGTGTMLTVLNKRLRELAKRERLS